MKLGTLMDDIARQFSELSKAFPAMGREIRRIRLTAQTNGHSRRIQVRPVTKAGPSKALMLHGRYLGLTRMLPARAKAQVRKIRIEKGVLAAIRAAKKAKR